LRVGLSNPFAGYCAVIVYFGSMNIEFGFVDCCLTRSKNIQNQIVIILIVFKQTEFPTAQPFMDAEMI
jgi:hypothetical protein